MLLGTETLLTYDVKLEFKDKPVNLKFYSDSSNNQELVVENNTYLALNGFMSLETEKKMEIPVYWEWKLETGESAKEIEDNDIIDTEFVGKTMSMQIAVTGTQVTSNPYANAVASTTINGRITVYDTVQDAIDAAGENVGAIITLLESEHEESIAIGEKQDIVLNMNGNTLTSTGSTIINRGKILIMGNGNVYGSTTTIHSRGIINIADGSIKAEGNRTSNIIAIWVYKGGVLNISGTAKIEGINTGNASGRAINNLGTTNVSGGIISGSTYGITNQEYGKLNIYDNAIIKTFDMYAICNTISSNEESIITIYGGTIIGRIITVGRRKG